jgi:hypothetical protein
MRTVAAVAGFLLFAVTLIDGFNTIVLPRRVRHVFRLTRYFYRCTWQPFSGLARRIRRGGPREDYLSVYGPLSLLGLLIFWAASLIVAFGLLQWSVPLRMENKIASLGDALYVSASSLLMVYGGQAQNTLSRWLATMEAGLGFAFLGLVVGFLPVLYQSYTNRELRIALLDARAGSPPSAGELLVRQSTNAEKLQRQLGEWEEWSAELLEEQLSYPMLAYFRSQHQNQSWLAALIALLDASTLVLVCSEAELRRQAYLTFAMGRHALVDLATVFHTTPLEPREPRLTEEDLTKLRGALQDAGTCLRLDCLTMEKLTRLRSLYEPYAQALSLHFLSAMPVWLPTGGMDNWLATTFEHPSGPFAVSDPFRRGSNNPAA